MILRLIVFLVIAVGGGLSATWYLVETGSALTMQRSGAWTTWTAAGRTDADPYTQAHFVRHPVLPQSSALVARYEATEDDAGRTLHSSCEYELEGPEPAGTWWSLSAFDDRGRLIRNDAERYSFNAATTMRSSGGRIRIRLARNARPGNWLPTGGAGRLTLLLQVEDATGTATAQPLPAIRRVSC